MLVSIGVFLCSFHVWSQPMIMFMPACRMLGVRNLMPDGTNGLLFQRLHVSRQLETNLHEIYKDVRNSLLQLVHEGSIIILMEDGDWIIVSREETAPQRL